MTQSRRGLELGSRNVGCACFLFLGDPSVNFGLVLPHHITSDVVTVEPGATFVQFINGVLLKRTPF